MLNPPGRPAALGPLRAVDRWEWRWTPGAQPPYRAVEDLLADAGLPVRDLAPRGPAGSPSAGATAGAVLLIGGGWPISEQASSPTSSPCPAVPDVAVVVCAPGGDGGPEPGQCRVGEWRPSWSDGAHRAAVDAVRAAIARGDLYQANVVGHRAAELTGDPAALASRLRAVPDAPWAGSVEGAGWAVHSASPELFLEVVGGRATTRPIKGTEPRRVGSADQDARSALRTSPKDRAEHVMIVDLERNDLGRVATVGGVDVPELYAVRPLAGLWHAESTVTATLRPGTGLADLLAATFPGGSVTGAPKLAALAEIARHEPVGRGPAMGALGWVGADGRIALGLTIRTVAVAADRAHVWTGGGITWSSDPAAEVAEAAAKAAPILAALAG
ncbi:MAG TPA: chorismate-binding protein [Mycobacteriales bacterium]|nr:chorismate-binding protein [Mycobacteriales bacterium]